MTYKKLISDSKKLDFTFIDFDYGNTQINVLKHTRLAQYEFTIHYAKTVKNHVKASYLQPEECDVDFEITDISGLIIYDVKNRIIDLNDEQNEEILTIIKNKLL